MSNENNSMSKHTNNRSDGMTSQNSQIEKATEIATTINSNRDKFSVAQRRAARQVIRRPEHKRMLSLPALAQEFSVEATDDVDSIIEELGSKVDAMVSMQPPVEAPEAETTEDVSLTEIASSVYRNSGDTNLPTTDTDTDTDTTQDSADDADENPSNEAGEADADTDTDTDGDTDTAASFHMETVSSAIAQEHGMHLGDLCGWSITGSRPKAKVIHTAEQLGLEEDMRFPKLTPNSAYRKAISMTFKQSKSTNMMAVLVEDSPRRIVHSLVATEVVEDDNNTVSSKDASFNTEIKVGFNKEADAGGASPGACLVTEDDTHPAAQELRKNYTHLLDTYLASDIRECFQAAFRNWKACPVLPHGGLWYIPSKYAEKVRAWAAFMRELQLVTVVVPSFDTKETLESLQNSTRYSLENQLADIVSQLDGYSAEGAASVRSSTLEKRAAEFDDLRSRAELYKTILGTTVSDLTKRIEVASQKLVKDISARKGDEEERRRVAKEARAAADKEKRRMEREAKKLEQAETENNETEDNE